MSKEKTYELIAMIKNNFMPTVLHKSNSKERLLLLAKIRIFFHKLKRKVYPMAIVSEGKYEWIIPFTTATELETKNMDSLGSKIVDRCDVLGVVEAEENESCIQIFTEIPRGRK